MSLVEFLNLDKFTWSSAVDLLIVSALIYYILLLIRGTRAFQMVLGVGFLVLFYYLTRWFDLETIQWMMTNILPYFVFGIIVLFANDIRRALANIGKNSLLKKFFQDPMTEIYDEIVLAATTLSSQRVGALIVIEREIGLKNYIESGITVDALLSNDILVSIFSPAAPLHDGAVIIQKNRVMAAACFLPLTLNPRLSKELGTRHRAAIGVTEESDAVVVVVSEETGIISTVVSGDIQRNLDSQSLRRHLARSFERFNASVSSQDSLPSTAVEEK